LFVSDQGKIMYWDLPTGGVSALSNNNATSGWVGVTDPTIDNYVYFSRIAVDQTNKLLWVLKSNRTSGDSIAVLTKYNLPATTGDLGISVVSVPISVLGESQPITSWSLSENTIAPTSDGQYIWATDRINNRVFRMRNLSTTPVVDIILGQPDPSLNTANYPSGNPSKCNLNKPGFVALDHQSPQNLYISDYSLEFVGNGRILRYDGKTFSDPITHVLYSCDSVGNPAINAYGTTIAASKVYGTSSQTDFTSTGYDCGVTLSSCRPWGFSFNSNDSQMLLAQDGQVGNHKFPVLMADSAPGAGNWTPVENLYDFNGQAYSTLIDSQNNFYVLDHNWSRVLVYFRPPLRPVIAPRQLRPIKRRPPFWEELMDWRWMGPITLYMRRIIPMAE
jgi:hypothetical protein